MHSTHTQEELQSVLSPTLPCSFSVCDRPKLLCRNNNHPSRHRSEGGWLHHLPLPHRGLVEASAVSAEGVPQWADVVIGTTQCPAPEAWSDWYCPQPIQTDWYRLTGAQSVWKKTEEHCWYLKYKLNILLKPSGAWKSRKTDVFFSCSLYNLFILSLANAAYTVYILFVYRKLWTITLITRTNFKQYA